MIKLAFVTFLSYLIGMTSGQSESGCTTFNTCTSCYSSMEGCQWCLQSGSYMCVSKEALNDNPCLGSNTNEALVCETDLDQISISRAIVQLQPGNSTSFKFTVKRPSNPELDFYMIMDLSFSLFDDLTTIKGISSDIVGSLQNISSNYAIGFGKFVDKLVFPYIAEITLDRPFSFLGKPSACRNDPCAAPTSYTHLLNLTNDANSFISVFDNLEISTNADNPEGTFDAMSQAVLCKDLVGWRDNSLKMLFVVTDATTHIAGDGKLAGIIKQSPKECKTVYDQETNTFTYLDNAKYDYPSVGEIRDLLFNYSVIPVFATLENIKQYYEAINVLLERTGPQLVTIQDGSANIVEAIESSIENVLSNVALRYVPKYEDIFNIIITATCPDGSSDGQTCSNVVADQTVMFQVNVTLIQCTEDLLSGSSIVTQVNIPGYGKFDLDIRGSCS